MTHACVGIALDRRRYVGLNSANFDLPVFMIGYSSLNKFHQLHKKEVHQLCTNVFFWQAIFDPSIFALIVSCFPGASRELSYLS